MVSTTSTACSLVSISRTIIMDCASMMPTTRFADMPTCIYGLRTAATIIAITIIYMVSVRPDLMSTRRKISASNKPTTKTSVVRTKTYTDGDVVVTTTYDNNGNVKSTQSSTWSAEMNNIKTDTDFMLQFGNMRVAFLDAIKDAGAKTLQTGIVVKMARMCKEYSKLLTQNEKKTCMNSINEMKDKLKKTNADTFMDGMLQEAWIALSK